jgi:tetratricopeptide (TPR) repeat protein
MACGSPGESEPPEVRDARALLTQNQAQAAFDLLESALESHPESAAHLVAFAEACQRLGRRRRGVLAIEKARALDPESHRALFVSALLDRDRHHPVDAMESMETAIRLTPLNVDYRVLLGNLRLSASDYVGAIDAFSAAHELASDDSRAVGGWGQALVLGGRHAEGRPLLDRYLKQQPYDAQAFYLRGLACFRERDLEGAETDFRRAIAIAPHLPSSYHNLARLLQMTGREEEAASVRERHEDVNARDWAIRSAQRKLEDDPHDDKTARELVRLLRRAGRNAEAAVVQQGLSSRQVH